MKTEINDLEQRLLAVNCDEALTRQITDLLLAGDKETVRLLLRRHRRLLMDALHESERKVDELDLLVYQINKDQIDLAG